MFKMSTSSDFKLLYVLPRKKFPEANVKMIFVKGERRELISNVSGQQYS